MEKEGASGEDGTMSQQKLKFNFKFVMKLKMRICVCWVGKGGGAGKANLAANWELKMKLALHSKMSRKIHKAIR